MNEVELLKVECAEIARNYLVIDLDQARKNAAAIKRYIGPATKMLAVVKANAYGHGLVECAKAFIEGGADYLGVAASDAAIHLRANGINSPILIFSEAEQLDYMTLASKDIEPAIYSLIAASKLSLAAQKLTKQAKFHLAIDTGMSRIGYPARLLLSTITDDELANLAKLRKMTNLSEMPNVAKLPNLAKSPNLDKMPDVEKESELFRQQLAKLQAQGSLINNLSLAEKEQAKLMWQEIKTILDDHNLACQGVFSHFAKADCLGDEASFKTKEQYLLLSAFVAYIRASGYSLPIAHIANSAATVRYPEYYLDMVRPGSILYGLPPANSPSKLPIPVKAIASWYAKIARIFVLQANETISYGGLWQSKADILVGVLAVGYADGYRRNLSNKTYVLLASGEKAPILGRICMDYCMIKLPNSYAQYLHKDISHLAPVKIMGDGEDSSLTADDLANIGDSFNLEICSNVAARVKRVYIQNGDIKAVKAYLFAQNSD